MRVFVYEFVTGGGLLSSPGSAQPTKSLLREGLAMVLALADDFAAILDCEVVLLRDHRLGDFAARHEFQTVEIDSSAGERQAFCEQAATADWTVVIAPEGDGHLLHRACLVEESHGRLLSPTPEIIALGSDKQATATHFARHGLSTPKGKLLTIDSPPGDLRFPIVLKPVDGAGSMGLQRVRRPEPLVVAEDSEVRIEEYHSGTSASVAVLRGPNAILVLPSCEQRLADEDSFKYLGGKVPLEEPLRMRAESLARSAAE